jgi:hypothetical protein
LDSNEFFFIPTFNRPRAIYDSFASVRLSLLKDKRKINNGPPKKKKKRKIGCINVENLGHFSILGYNI